jgi:hypothetical protein
LYGSSSREHVVEYRVISISRELLHQFDELSLVVRRGPWVELDAITREHSDFGSHRLNSHDNDVRWDDASQLLNDLDQIPTILPFS